MKIICLKENLKRGLGITSRAVGKNPSLPILSNILLSVDKKGLKISATDLELGISVFVQGKTEKEGEITVPAKLFSDLVNNLPEEKITLETGKDFLTVSFDRNKSVVRGLSVKDFPIIPIAKEDVKIKLECDSFKSGLMQVINSASNSDLRPEISGIFVSFQDNNVKLVSTDSFRLSEKTISVSSPLKDLKINSFIIPQKTASELIKILEDKNDFEIYPEKNQVFFKTENIELVSRLIEGEYPDYSQIIPKSFKTKILVNKKDLFSAVKLAGLFATKINDIKIKVVKNKSVLEVFARSADVGENLSPVKADIEGDEDTKGGEDMEITFNYRYLVDGLNNIVEDKILIHLNDNLSPVLLKQKISQDYIYIIMPIRG